MARKKKEKDPNKKSLWAEFKEFINKGNAFMLAVGVVIGGAFNAIVTALVNILMSVATWGVPGGLKGLVTVLPAASKTQEGLPGIGQKFDVSQLQAMTIQFAKNAGVDVSNAGTFISTAEDGTVTILDSAGYASMQSGLLGKYNLHGATYTYCNSAVIDWGTFINAVLAFIIIAITLFIIVKVTTVLAKKREEAKAKLEEKLALKKGEGEEPAKEE